MQKIFDLANKYIILATPLILYTLFSSIYLIVSANGNRLINLIFALILLVCIPIIILVLPFMIFSLPFSIIDAVKKCFDKFDIKEKNNDDSSNN